MACKKCNVLNSYNAQQPPPALRNWCVNPSVQNLVPPAKKQIQDIQKLLRSSTPFTYPSEEVLPLFKTQNQTDDGNGFPALEAEPPRAVSHRHGTFA